MSKYIDHVLDKKPGEFRDAINERLDTLIQEKLEALNEEPEEIHEARRIKRVDYKGHVKKRLKCRPGFKVSSDGKRCEKISGSEKLRRKKGLRKALRTKKSKGTGAAKRASRRRRIALRKRKARGL